MRLTALPLIALLCLALAKSASAWEEINPKQIRVITPTSATSDCIDRPKSPVCAVETVLACTRRIDKAMCARAGITNFHYQDKPEEKFRYRILSVKVLARKDIPKWQWEKPDGLRPDDVEVVVQNPDEHYSSHCQKSGCNTSFWVKPDSIDWRVVSWAAWYAD
ncbi:exported hypothetical protein [Rhodospirillaceae bacterium LM-1]|nr:exported hypothetical protein [Rhodospirillaceae bacterium LM-1]